MSKTNPLLNIEPISEDFIAKHNVELFDTWTIKDEQGNSFGPFQTDTLREASAADQDFFETVIAFNFATEKEKPFFQNTKFQRRKPKLVSLQGVECNDEFYLLIKGVKKGPYTLNDVKLMLEKREVALNNMASMDKGKSWIKIFEHHEFDRRLLKNKEELPFSPNETELSKFDSSKVSKAKEADEALVGLAFIGRGNDKGQRIKSFSKSTSVKAIVKKENNFHFSKKAKIGTFITAMLVMVMVGFNTMNSNFGSSEDSFAEVPSKKIEQAVTAKVENTSPVNRKPAKVIQAKKYRPIQRNIVKAKILPNRKEPVKRYREIHSDDGRYETVDLDNPKEKEDLTRSLAGDFGDDELSEEELEFIERAENGELSEKEMDSYKTYLDQKRGEFEEFE